MNRKVVNTTVSVFIQRQVECMCVPAERLPIRTFAAKDGGDKGGVLIPDSFMYSHEMCSDPFSERDCFFDAGQHF